ncbi:MAG: metallophosphoesterase family protein [Planctomycetota bacterium]
MRIGVLADSHDNFALVESAIRLLVEQGAEAIFHCGDLTTARVVDLCGALPFYFVFGNHDADSAPELLAAAEADGVHCLQWGGAVSLDGTRVAICHGHMTSDLRPLLDAEPDYLLTGHTHERRDSRQGKTRRVCPGALYRTDSPSVAIIDLLNDDVTFHSVS